MTITVKDDKGQVVVEFLFGQEKISTSGKPNRYAGGKLIMDNKQYQLGCNMTEIKK
jgi:hypothetical protein